ncbi:MAG: helix-turn-helix transcriptional regulator [Solirubrobacterales bacterium]
MEHALAAARDAAELVERDAVASELKELVARAGTTQAEFARRLGTSPPRLSSYVNGAVVPAATLMVRARTVAARSTGG